MHTVICFFAHPDDEIYAGGTLAHMVTHGVAVHLVCATRGEHGALGYPPLDDPSQLGAIRSQEMACAAETLGAASLTFLGYVDEVDADGGQMEFHHDPDTLHQQLTTLINQHQPDVVLTHGSDGEYGHPAHKLMHRAVIAAAQATDRPPLVYGFQADFAAYPYRKSVNTSDPAHLIIETDAYREAYVMKMLACHHTQSSYWIYLKSQELHRQALPIESWHLFPQEGLHRHFPPADALPLEDTFTRWYQQTE